MQAAGIPPALGGAAANACNLPAAPAKHGAGQDHVILVRDGGISARRTQKHPEVEYGSAVLPAAVQGSLLGLPTLQPLHSPS